MTKKHKTVQGIRFVTTNSVAKGGWYCEVKKDGETVHTTLIGATREQVEKEAMEWVFMNDLVPKEDEETEPKENP
jgi:hypothetical protein